MCSLSSDSSASYSFDSNTNKGHNEPPPVQHVDLFLPYFVEGEL